MSDPTPPFDRDAEESILGAMLLGRDAREVGLDLDPADFYIPLHVRIFSAIAARHAIRSPIDVVTIANDLGSDVRPELLRIQASVPASANAAAYVEIVSRLAFARRAIGLSISLRAAGQDSDVERIMELIDAGVRSPAAKVQAIELDELLLRAPELGDSKPWVIPGMLRRRERVVITGGEGWGKSTLLRQMLVSVSSGLHPLLGLAASMDGPRSTLLVDLQEDDLDLANAMLPMRRKAGEAYATGMLHAFARPAGMNLLAGPDRRWLEGLIAQTKPELVAIGPIRKLVRTTDRFASKSGEEAVDEVTRILDDLRVEYDFALVMEGHAGHDRNDSNFRIRGSSVWLDWPEFGIGMKPVEIGPPRMVELVDWRGARHTGRAWPKNLVGSRGWPWAPDNASYERLCRALDLDWLIDGGTGQEGLPV